LAGSSHVYAVGFKSLRIRSLGIQSPCCKKQQRGHDNWIPSNWIPTGWNPNEWIVNYWQGSRHFHI